MKSKKIECEAFYLDWFNNYLTVEKIAEHYGIGTAQAYILINYGRQSILALKTICPLSKQSRKAKHEPIRA